MTIISIIFSQCSIIYWNISIFKGNILNHTMLWHNIAHDITVYRLIVPMESVSLRLYSDAYPCHRVSTHRLISVI